jgi:hypothetical protein
MSSSETELAFATRPVFEDPITHQETVAPSKLATFRQINLDVSYTHHDALELSMARSCRSHSC